MKANRVYDGERVMVLKPILLMDIILPLFGEMTLALVA